MAGQQQRRGQEELVATYTDRRKRRHRIVLRDRLVLDLCARRPAAVVAELSPEEGLDQAIGAVFGGEFDPGYIARAEAGEGTLGRRLRAEDLDARQRPTRPSAATTAIRSTTTGGWQHDGQGRCPRAAPARPAHRPRRLH